MLKGKIALVTGGSRGIGRAIALAMAENGADVAVIYAGNTAAADETCRLAGGFGVRAAAFRCDVADFARVKETVSAVVGELGGLDILVNNAGVTRDALLFGMKEEDYDAVLGTNLKGAFNMTKHCCPHFIRRRAGSILNIASVAGLTGNAGQTNYSASKAGLIGLTKATARELAGRGITCNAIAPGLIESEMTAALEPGQLGRMVGMVPLGRMGLPREVAELAVFLASDKAKYITGEVVRVDGGLAM